MSAELGHSPLGASGIYRVLACPGSMGISRGIEDAESDHAALGTAAHSLGEACLRGNRDAWEYLGAEITKKSEHQRMFSVIEVDKDMADAVQVYLDAVRTMHPDRNQGNSWVERGFKCPSIHEYFWGTSDFCHHAGDTLHVWDYKHGAGIVVEVEDNPQLKYYACGMLEDLGLWETVDKVVLHIAQPRGFHYDGPIRSWGLTTEELVLWLEGTLVPAMDRALVSRETKSGEHCRFCPARSHACPQIMADFDELEVIMAQINAAGGAGELTNEQLGRFLNLLEVAKIAAKAAKDTTFARLSSGKAVPGWKLGKAKANRVWKDGAEAALKKKFRKAAFTEPKLKSPAQIDEMPEGLTMTARHAFKPDAGLTVIPEGDARPAVNATVKSMFSDQTKKRGKAA